MCLAQGHKTMTLVGIEPRTSRFGVRRSTSTPPIENEKNVLLYITPLHQFYTVNIKKAYITQACYPDNQAENNTSSLYYN